ncbi:hypothetical protein NUM3379_21110 [Kineococcus sp. NUM-3379]
MHGTAFASSGRPPGEVHGQPFAVSHRDPDVTCSDGGGRHEVLPEPAPAVVRTGGPRAGRPGPATVPAGCLASATAGALGFGRDHPERLRDLARRRRSNPPASGRGCYRQDRWETGMLDRDDLRGYVDAPRIRRRHIDLGRVHASTCPSG